LALRGDEESLLPTTVRCRFLPPAKKITIKLEFDLIEEFFYGNPIKNIKSACQVVIDGDHV
jgi:hypothetical protein